MYEPQIMDGGPAIVDKRDNSLSGSTNVDEVSKTLPPYAAVNDNEKFQVSAILDGSKLILRLGQNTRFTFEHPCRAIMATSGVQIDRPLGWLVSGTCNDLENTVVLDAYLLGHRFIPIPLGYYKTVYTKYETIHVTVGNSIVRTKVHSRNLPYRTCNKFQIGEDTIRGTEPIVEGRGGWPRTNAGNNYTNRDANQTVTELQNLSSNPESGSLYIRGNDSLVRYKLREGERIVLHHGFIAAWTLGVKFEKKNYCCCRITYAAHGEGTIWVEATASGTNAASVV